MVHKPSNSFTRQGQQADRVELELAARRSLILIHGMLGVEVGLAILVTGAPDFIETWFSPWSRVVLATLAVIPGILVLIGTRLSERRLAGWRAIILGLAGLTVWYGSMGLAYLGLLLHRGVQAVQIGQPLDPGVTGRGYVPLVYLALMMLVGVHIVTVIRLGRPAR